MGQKGNSVQKTCTVPGTAWVALIVALTGALSGWLTEWIDAPWAPLAVLGISTVVKLIQMGYEIYGPKPVAPTARSLTVKPSFLTRVLFD